MGGVAAGDKPPRPGLQAPFPAQKLCREVPDVVDDPPLPLTSQESLTSAQLQRLANLHGVSSLRSVGRPTELSRRPPPSSPSAGSSFVPPAQGPRGPRHVGPPEACPSPGTPTPGCLLCPVRGLATLLDPYPSLSLIPLVMPLSVHLCSSLPTARPCLSSITRWQHLSSHFWRR